MTHRRFLSVMFLVIVLATPSYAQRPIKPAGPPPRIDPAGIGGHLLMGGPVGEPSAEMIDKFVELAGGPKSKIVILEAGKSLNNAKRIAALQESMTAATKKRDLPPPRVEGHANAVEAFKDATGVWLHVASASSWGVAVREQPALKDECRALLQRGGVLGTNAIGSNFMASAQNQRFNAGWSGNILPDSLIGGTPVGKFSPLLETEMQDRKGIVGYEIERDSAMLVSGRTIHVIGPGKVRVMLPNGAAAPSEIVLDAKSKADLTALRRAARDRVDNFPPKQPALPIVEKGTLVIVGGGGSPDGLYKKFVEYAGGADKANIVIFPTANDPIPKRDVVANAFKKAGAKKTTILYGTKLAEVESKEFLDSLKEATGLWFDGGRQWRFVDCYENTKALPLMHDVLARGGVIGGTSAGATIQGDYLCRGGVFNNFDIRYKGYERGLGFLKGVAIDQHFSQRKRLPEMTALMKTYPQYLGIGLDEATAIVVKGQIADVIGKGKAHFYDAQRKVEKGQPDFEALTAGQRYDLKERKALPAGNP